MKKIIFIVNFALFASVLSAQSGSGTSGDPYYGTISSPVTWSGSPSTRYVGTSENNDLTIASDGHLTIAAGMTIIFTQLTTDLFITGTGQLTAGGVGSAVTFTKDPGKANWGHISFQNMEDSPASSTFENCIFEYGYSVGSGSQSLLFGGAIQIDFNDVVITNCTFRNNYANYAGAISINFNRNTIIRNSYFELNAANECGGALIIYSGSTALVENCIFAYNYSKGQSSANYSGGAIWSYSNTSKTVNCTFVENTSDRAGDAFFSYSSPGSMIVNSIFWGSNDQLAVSGTSATITTCAFENTKYWTAANSIIISDVDSHHFTDAGNDDWSLRVISPCRDAGTTPSPTVPNDYDGNPRVGAYDIGAYEVQYNYWLTAAGSTDWTEGDNWNGGAPTSSQNIVIPTGATNYPTGSSSQNYTIGAGYGMVLDPGAQATFGTLTTTGDLRLRSDASNISSLIINSIDVTAIVDIYLTGGEAGTGNYRWHYISSPFSTSPSITPFTDVTLNLVEYIESLCTSTSDQGWVAFDGYIYKTGGNNETSFSTLTSGKGYNFYDNVNNEITISGDLANGNVAVGLNFNGNATPGGFNLLGNPFSSGLDWDVIIGDASYPGNTSKGVYFTRNNTQCSYIGGVGTPFGVTGIIPPMQGFFTKTYSTLNTITLLASARTHNSIHARYKGKSTIPLVRLSITKDSISDETVIRFDEQADPGLDYDFDALKMFLSDDKISIYSYTGETKYAINGQPFPETEVDIPIAVNLVSEGDHKISAIQLQGLDNYNLTLKDLVTGFVVDLKTTPELTFTDTAGTYTDRFILTISSTTGIEDIPDLPGLFNVFTANNLINIRTLSDAWNGKSGTVRIFDITGRTVSELHNTEFWKNSILQVPAPSAKGIYFVELRAGGLRYVGKVSAGY